MTSRFTDSRMADGSRHFADLPETYNVQDPEWHQLHRHLQATPGVAVTGFLTDDVTEAWINFMYRGHCFSLNNPQGRWWIFVEDPTCPDEILGEVHALCAAALPPD